MPDRRQLFADMVTVGLTKRSIQQQIDGCSPHVTALSALTRQLRITIPGQLSDKSGTIPLGSVVRAKGDDPATVCDKIANSAVTAKNENRTGLAG